MIRTNAHRPPRLGPKPASTANAHFIGLDLGQSRDYSALAVVSASKSTRRLRLEFLEQCPLGLSYAALPPAIHQIIDVLGHNRHATLAIDATGPGRPVVDMIRRSGLQVEIQPFVIGAGNAGCHFRNGIYSIGRETLLSALRAAIETRRLVFPANLPCKPLLIDQLLGNGHDDLVFAIALAVVSATMRNQALPEAA